MERIARGSRALRLGAAGFLLLLAADAAKAEAPGVRRALLFGVNEYRALPDLRGALNDVDLLRSVLTSRFGFDDKHIRVVTDADATRKGILAALEKLVEETGPDDVVYIHYSGHGSQVLDQNGDEPDDEADETLVPHDGRTAGVPDVTDDELAALLARLRSRHAVVVLDSCHSGTATRGGTAFRTRAVPPDDRTELYVETGATTRAIVPLPEERHVLLSAARADQSALDGPVDGRPHGLFSFSLGRSLSTQDSGSTPRDVFAAIETELGRIKAQLGLNSMPEPQLEGPAARLADALLPRPREATPAAEEPEPPRLPFAEVRRAGEAGMVILAGAARLGAAPGAVWAIYPAGELSFPPGGALAEVHVTEVREADVTGRLEPTDASVPEGARAVALAPPPPERRISVRWLDEDSARARRLRESLRRELPALDFVPEGRFARFVVRCDGAGCEVTGADGVSPVVSISGTDDTVFVAELARLFSRSLTAAELLALDNPASTLRLRLAVEGGGEAGGGQTRAPRYRIRLPEEPRTPENSLQLRVEASEECYLTVVDLDPEGRVQVLFPNAISEKRNFLPRGFVPGGTAIHIPDSLASGNRAGFHIDYAPPPGTDTLRAFCSASVESAESLRGVIHEIAQRNAGGVATRQARDAAAELERLRLGLVRLASRGLALVPDEPPDGTGVGTAPPLAGDWTAASLTIEVTEGGAEDTSAPAARAEEIPFLDSAAFDARLAEALKRGAPVVAVRFVAPVASERVPARIERWLDAVGRRYQGAVTVEADPSAPAARDAVELGLSLIFKTYEVVRKQLLYRPARSYDAVVFVLPEDGRITRLEFRRKRERGAESG